MDRNILEFNLEFILNYLKSHGKIKLISEKYHRADKLPKRKKTLGKSTLRSVISAKNVNVTKKNDNRKKYKVKFDIFESNS